MSAADAWSSSADEDQEPPAATIERLRHECEHLRWERDQLASQAANVRDLWWQLAEMAAECDTLRAEVARLQAGRPPAKAQTDQLAWITMAFSGRLPDELTGPVRE